MLQIQMCIDFNTTPKLRLVEDCTRSSELNFGI